MGGWVRGGVFPGLAVSGVAADPAIAGPQSFPVDGSNPGSSWQSAELRADPPRRPHLGGGFIEFLFGGGRAMRAAPNDPNAYEQAAPCQQALREPPARSESTRRP